MGRRSFLHLIDSLNPARGGPAEFVRALSREHAAMGHRCCAALMTRSDGEPQEGLEIVSAGSRGHGGYGYRPGAVAWLREAAHQYDAIFVHGLWQYQGACAWLALSPLDTPYYLFPHGMLDLWISGDWKKNLKKRLYWEAVEKHVAGKARAVLFTSEGEMERAPRAFGAPWRAQELVKLGAADPPPDAEGQREAFLSCFPALRGRRILLFLGRIHPKKGCELLARAFAEMKPPGWDLVFAGPCVDPVYQAQLNGERVHFTGTIEGAVKWGALRCAEVFALPSHQENFGIAVAEALACGTPVLISTAVDIHKDVTNAGAGFADKDDIEGTRNLLGRWTSLGETERAGMASAAADCFRTHFRLRRTAERIVELVEKRNR